MSVSPVVVAGFRAVLDSYTIGTRLAAELIAAATVHRSRIALSATNVGRTWPAVFATGASTSTSCPDILRLTEEVATGIYAEQMLPRIINVACGMKVAAPLRSRVCEGLHGQVVEIGFGSGLNIPHYPAATGVPASQPGGTGAAPEQLPDVMFPKMFGGVAAPIMLADLLPIVRDWEPDLIVHDAAELAGPIVAALLDIPNVVKSFGALTPRERVAAAGDEVAPLWRSLGLDPRPFGG